jgi:hypothetical protein
MQTRITSVNHMSAPCGPPAQIRDASGKYAAHKLFNIETAFFNWCLARDLIEASPCAGARASAIIGRKEPRQRVLNEAEIRALWAATEGGTNSI